MFKKYTSSLWSLNLPQNWDISSDEDCVTFQSKPPVGVLQVSAYSKDSAITVRDVQEFMQSHIKAEKKIYDAHFDLFSGFTVHYTTEDFYCKEWWLYFDRIMLYVSYTVDLIDKGLEDTVVHEILKTLRPILV